MKHMLLTLLFVLPFAFKSSAQTLTPQQAQIKALMQLVGNATMKGDYETVLANTHPKAIALGGGKDSLLRVIKKTFGQLQADGITIKNVMIGNPGEIVSIGSQKFAVAPQTVAMKVTGGTLSAQSSTLAISDDQGAHWYLIGSGSVSDQALFTLFPQLKGKLTIPKFGQPVFTPDGKEE